MGIMVLERGSSVHQVVPEQSVVANPEAIVVSLEIQALEDMGDIVFRVGRATQRAPRSSASGDRVHLHAEAAAE